MQFIYCHYKEILLNECENSLRGRKYYHLLYMLRKSDEAGLQLSAYVCFFRSSDELFVISILFYDMLFVYEVCQINSIQFNSILVHIVVSSIECFHFCTLYY